MIEGNDINALLAKIQILEEENEALSQNSEDLLLINTLLDEITKPISQESLFQSVLEKISILKNIPLCAFFSETDNGLRLEAYYALFDINSNSKIIINLLPDSAGLINSDPVFLNKQNINSVMQQLSVNKEDFDCTEILLIPFTSLMIENGVLFLADKDPSGNRLSKNITFVTYVLKRITERFNSLFYQGELEKINYELEGRVIERANELFELNKQLRLEIEERRSKELKLNQQTEELFFLNRFVEIIRFANSVDIICKTALDYLIDHLKLDIAFIFIKNGDLLELMHVSAKEQIRELINIPVHKVGECMCGMAVAQNRSLFSKNIFEDERCTWEECKKSGFKSFASLPLHNDTEVIGVLGISSFEETDFELQSQFLETIASELSLAFVHADTHQKIIAAEEKMRVIVEGTPHLFFYTQDKNALVNYVSPTVEIITGHTVEDWLNQKHWFITDSQINEIAKERTLQNLEGKVNTEPIIVEILHANGNPILLEVFEYPIYKSGTIIGLQGVAHDITERRRAELEIIKAKEHAEEMNRLKSNFLANMSHELRTPLVGLLGFSEILSGELLGEHKSFAQKVYSSGKRLLYTLNRLLNYSEVESNQVKIKLQNVDAVNVVKECIDSNKNMALEKGLYINHNFNGSNLIIETDEQLLFSIIDNLLNNAIKYTLDGGVTVALEEKVDSVIFTVEDTGIGIPKDKHKFIFEEFRQLSEGMGRLFDGTGLGLSIVKKYTELLNGTITLESKINSGSKFNVTIPKNSIVKKELKQKQISKVNRNKLDYSNIAKKILIVDDEPVNLDVIRYYLLKHFTINIASSAADAILQSNQIKFDLILMDINLKHGMDGLKAANEIRKIKGYQNIPIVAMTAYAMEGDKKEFLSSGCTHYLAKPFSKNSLLNLLHQIFNGNGTS